MNGLFYELIRVAIGSADSLSHTPSIREWKALYDMANKQNLVGVCFAGVQRLGADSDDGYYRVGMSEELYMTWMGVAAQISIKNEIVNQQCVELQNKLSAGGFRSSILKGQGIAALYNQQGNDDNCNILDLSLLRQSGDIDVWIDANEEETLRWVRTCQAGLDFDYKHVHFDAFEDTSVEIHYRPSTSRVPWLMKEVVRFTKENCSWDNSIDLGSGKVNVPSLAFNVVYILQHIFSHLFAQEMTLKQYLDYYFVLQAASDAGVDFQAAYSEMRRVGLSRFAKATMWLLHEVFGLEEEKMVCKMDEKEGRFLLNRVIAREFKQIRGEHGSARWHLSVFKEQLFKNFHLLTHYPLDVLFSPIWLIYHFCWKRLWRLGHKELFYLT